MNEAIKKEVEDVKQAVKYSSLLSYMFKPPFLLTKGFKENNKAQDKLFKNVCDFGSQA